MDNKQLRTFRKHLRSIEREVVMSLKDQTSCCGVTVAQCHVLLELDDLGTPSIVELAERLKLDASTLSRTVDGLVREGLVGRADNPLNRRSSIISLTDRGRTVCGEIHRRCDEFYGTLFAQVPADRHERLFEAVGLLADVFAQLRFAGEGCGVAGHAPKPRGRRS